MAGTRKITTRLAVEGEAEYKNAMRSINAELRALDTEVKKVSSDFKEKAALRQLREETKQADNIQGTPTKC